METTTVVWAWTCKQPFTYSVSGVQVDCVRFAARAPHLAPRYVRVAKPTTSKEHEHPRPSKIATEPSLSLLLDLVQHLALHQVPVAQLAVLRPGHHVRVVVRQRRVHLVLGVLVARVVREQLPRLLVQQADRAVQCGLLIAVPTPTLTNTARFKVQGSRFKVKVQGPRFGERRSV